MRWLGAPFRLVGGAIALVGVGLVGLGILLIGIGSGEGFSRSCFRVGQRLR